MDGEKCTQCGATGELHRYRNEPYCVPHYNALKIAENLLNTTDKPAPSLVELEQQALTVRNEMTAVVIVDQATYDKAVEKRVAASTWLKTTKEWFDGMKKPAHAAWMKICSNEKQVCDPVESVIRQINNELVRYDNQQELLRRQEQARLEAEALRQAEEQRIADAEHMVAQGMEQDDAIAVLDAPIAVAAPVAAPMYTKSKAVVMADNWVGVCDDIKKVIAAAAKGNGTALGLLQINQTSLNQLGKALKEGLAQAVPGCRGVNNRGIRSGRG